MTRTTDRDRPEAWLAHESLDVYGVALDFLSLAMVAAGAFPKGHGPVADQLRRAATSISLNIAEGYAKRSSRERARFYDIARASAHECGAIFDVAQRLEIIDAADWRKGKSLLHRVVSMLVRMIDKEQAQ